MKEFTNYDVIIAGSGIAGLYAALNLSTNLKILVLSKKQQTLCNSALAQGGIAGVYKNPADNPEKHKQDTLIAGGFENKIEAVDILVNEAKLDIDNIIKLGVDFDKTPDGNYHRTLEGGHGMHRIFHHADTTGFEILTTLIDKVKELSNVTVIEDAIIFDIKKTSTGFSFDVLQNNIHVYYNSHFTVLATGGIGRVYKYTTNSAIATGDGITFAYNMGAKIKNLHYVQFHPTAFNYGETRECLLISESVRGEGAYLYNCNKERFMQRYDERLELAPRDVVSHCIVEESKKTHSENFYLDITYKDPEFVRNRFPMINQHLLEHNIDMTKDLIPVYPCQHYLMGGIDVDTYSRTSIDNLFACGECSCTGVHGNNRLASNSLLEALVFSRRAASVINKACSPEKYENYDFPVHTSTTPIPKGTRTKIRTIMQESYFVEPDREGLVKSMPEITKIKEMLDNGDWLDNSDYVIARSLATVAYIILKEVL